MPLRIDFSPQSILDWGMLATAGKRLSWSALWMLIVLVQVDAVAADSPVSSETLAKRRQAIQQLNESQRQELVRKYTSYRELNESERNQLRGLHKDIEADAELKDVMLKYCEWLKNLDVTQREQLRQAKTPEQKRNLVERFRKEQSQRKDEVWRDNATPPPERRLMPPLSSEDLKSVMDAIESAFIKEGVISKEQQSELEEWNGSQRYKHLIQALGEYRHPKEGPARPLEIPESVVSALEDTVRNQEFKLKIRGAMRNPDQRHNIQKAVFLGLCWSTLEQAKREFNGGEKTNLKDSVFKHLSPEMQARVSQLPPWQLDLALMQSHRDEIWRAFAKAGDLPLGPGERGQPGRGYPPFGPQKRETPREGPRPPPSDARRPVRDRLKNEADKRD